MTSADTEADGAAQSDEGACERALHLFAAGRFGAFTGLPEGCGMTAVTALFPALEGEGRGPLGRRSAAFRMVIVGGYTQPVRVWFEGERVLMLDAEYPPIDQPLPALLAELGEPDARIAPAETDALDPVVREHWAYCSRGLTLYPNLERGTLWRLTAYPPTTLEDYRASFLLDLQVRVLPRGNG